MRGTGARVREKLGDDVSFRSGADVLRGATGGKCAACGRLRVGKDFLHVAGLVGAAMCSAY